MHTTAQISNYLWRAAFLNIYITNWLYVCRRKGPSCFVNKIEQYYAMIVIFQFTKRMSILRIITDSCLLGSSSLQLLTFIHHRLLPPSLTTVILFLVLTSPRTLSPNPVLLPLQWLIQKLARFLILNWS